MRAARLRSGAWKMPPGAERRFLLKADFLLLPDALTAPRRFLTPVSPELSLAKPGEEVFEL